MGRRHHVEHSGGMLGRNCILYIPRRYVCGYKKVEADFSKYDYYVLEDDENFKKVYLAEMKFNRMVIYNQNILHQPYILPNTFSDENPRLMQMFFI